MQKNGPAYYANLKFPNSILQIQVHSVIVVIARPPISSLHPFLVHSICGRMFCPFNVVFMTFCWSTHQAPTFRFNFIQRQRMTNLDTTPGARPASPSDATQYCTKSVLGVSFECAPPKCSYQISEPTRSVQVSSIKV